MLGFGAFQTFSISLLTEIDQSMIYFDRVGIYYFVPFGRTQKNNY